MGVGPWMAPAFAALVVTSALRAQTIPADCYRVARHREGAMLLAAAPAVAQRLRPLLVGVNIDDPRPTRADARIRALWKQDSTAVESALAGLIADPLSGADVVANAAAWYRTLSGRPMPLLAEMDGVTGLRRRLNALASVQALATADDAARTYAMACDAGWLLVQLEHDPQYARILWHGGGAEWPGLAANILREAERLLPAAYRPAIAQLRAVAESTEARAFAE